MTAIRKTKHAGQRMAQRGFRDDDAQLILLVGTRVPDGFLVRKKDCQRAIERLERLEGARLVEESGQIITAYRPGRRTERKLLRYAEERDFAD